MSKNRICCFCSSNLASQQKAPDRVVQNYWNAHLRERQSSKAIPLKLGAETDANGIYRHLVLLTTRIIYCFAAHGFCTGSRKNIVVGTRRLHTVPAVHGADTADAATLPRYAANHCTHTNSHCAAPPIPFQYRIRVSLVTRMLQICTPKPCSKSRWRISSRSLW